MTTFSDPKDIVRRVGIQPGMIVADFGSGSGRYVMEIATALAATGSVYAIDVKPELSTHVAAQARECRFSNVDVIVGDVTTPGGTFLAHGCLDLVVMSNLLSQLVSAESKRAALNEAKRVLRPGGRVLVVDWQDTSGMETSAAAIGPRPEHIVTKTDAEALFQKSGFSTERIIDAGSHHYGYVFKKL